VPYKNFWLKNLEQSSKDWSKRFTKFFIDNAHLMYNTHPNIFITPFDVQVMRTHQLAVELGSTDGGRRNSLKALVLLVVILSLMNNVFGFE
jgi:hypothetical protein